jgi:hypothetical protein
MPPGMLVLAFSVGELEFARRAAEWIEITAIIVIAGSILIAFGAALLTLMRPQQANQADKGVSDEITGLSDLSSSGRAIRLFKRVIAGGLLMGLDLLIAADVIKTVTVEATLENIVSLGLLVLVRTFLSWSLILEVTGRWPWQRRQPSDIVD